MQTGKRRPGRPRKEAGTVECTRFVRAGIAMAAYDEARQNDQKHSVAVRQAVESGKTELPGVANFGDGRETHSGRVAAQEQWNDTSLRAFHHDRRGSNKI